MTPSIAVLAWMSVVAALGHVSGPRGRTELLSYAVLQVLCFAAGAMEAGAAESGRPVAGTAAARYAAVLAGAWYMGLLTYLGWTGP